VTAVIRLHLVRTIPIMAGVSIRVSESSNQVPFRQIRAVYTDQTVTVYQAYSPAIAEAALAAGRFVPPFSRGRATWIKPSFLWMAYRSGWGGKDGQERVLAIEITRAGFEWALEHACLSHYEAGTYADHAAWRQRMDATCVRIQWDPERGLHHEPLGHRSIQVGLIGQAVARYVDDWIVSILDVTPLMFHVRDLVAAGQLGQAGDLLPAERPYPVGGKLASLLGMVG
jgi:hypothetical protein